MIAPEIQARMIVAELFAHLLVPLLSVIVQLLAILDSIGAVVR